MAAIVDAIGVISGLLTIFSFFDDQFNDDAGDNGVGFVFKVGLDGAVPPDGGDPLGNAGGNIPDVRVYNEHGEALGITTNDNNYCGSADDNCKTSVSDIEQQPTYTLFSGNTDALCIAYVSVTFPGGDKYAWVGNWGQQCNAPWYYSDIYLQTDSGSTKVSCTWVDANGDISTTGFQVHWPEYNNGFAGNGNSAQYYCDNAPPLNFYTDPDPNTLTFWTRKRDIFATHPSVGTSPALDRKRESASQADSVRRSLKDDHRLIKSQSAQHPASELCSSASSVGPSFVSYDECTFCDMSSKTLYHFCEDVATGDCWNDADDTVLTKSAGAMVRRSIGSDLSFDQTIQWGQD